MPQIKVYNSLFIQPVQQVQVDNQNHTLWFGQDNSFPLRLAQLVQESPAASSCISILADFIEGNDFSDPTLKSKIINSQGQTLGDLHNLVSESYALFEGFTIMVKYTREGKISEMFHVPFENARLYKPDDKGIISKVVINPYFGTGLYKREFDKEFDTFNPDPKVVLAQMARDKNKYKGQILYVAFTRPLSRFYPLPYYYSAHNWMAIDAGIGQFHNNNLEAGFFQTVLLKMIGDPNQPSQHPDDQKLNAAGQTQSIRTAGERFELEMQKFTGSDSKTKMMVLWEMMKDQMPELQAFPSTTNENFFTVLQELTTKNILIATKIPAILANMSKDGSLSDGTQMANATKVMHDRVAKTQNLLERTYAKLLSFFKEPYTGEVKILNTNSFDDFSIDPLIWASLSLAEQREWIKKNTSYPIMETAPTQPTNKFVNIFFTDYPQKARDNAKKALDFMNDNPCGTSQGKITSQAIIDGKPLSFKDIRRLYNYLKRNQIHDNKLFSDSCDACKFAAWGGSAMLDYCAEKIKMINE